MEDMFKEQKNTLLHGFPLIKNPCLPLLFASGTHFEVGFSIGERQSAQIQTFYSRFTTLLNVLLPFYHSRAGRDCYDEYLSTCQEGFPQYLEEIKGMSQGSGVPFEQMFMMNCLNEMVMLSESPVPSSEKFKGCSTIFINKSDLKLLAHNEDNDPCIGPYAYMISAKIDDPTVPKKIMQADQEFITAYCYPGVIPGGSFGFNSHGMVFTCNSLYANIVLPQRTPRIFIGRSLFSASSIHEVLNLLDNNTYGSSYGFCLNVASTTEVENMWSVEIGPGADRVQYHLHTVSPEFYGDQPCHYYHFNSFKHLQIAENPAVRTGSSFNRSKQASEMEPPRDAEDIKKILGNTVCENYPLYRTPSATDKSQTLATGIFDILLKKVDIYLENPKYCSKPMFTLPLDLI